MHRRRGGARGRTACTSTRCPAPWPARPPRIGCHLVDQDGLLVHVADNGLADRLKPPSTTARTALVAEARPKHRVAANAERGLRHEPQRRADLAAGVVVIAVEALHAERRGRVGWPREAIGRSGDADRVAFGLVGAEPGAVVLLGRGSGGGGWALRCLRECVVDGVVPCE